MIRSSRAVLVLSLVFAIVAGCGGGDSGSDGGAGSDAGDRVDATTGTDAGSDIDAGSEIDAGDSDTDGGGDTDAGSDTDAGVDTDAGSDVDAGTDVDAGDAATEIDGGPTCTPAACTGHFYECGDCIDSDADGLIDSADPDCLGPCDNTESSYYGGIPGLAGPACLVDCYFDQDSGAGNDDCYWSHECDPHEVAPSYYPESSRGAACAYDPSAAIPGTSQSCDQLLAAQSATCAAVCAPLVPNGCDCFGCCELVAGSGQYVYLGSVDGSENGTCSQSDAADPTRCQPCMPVTACLNTCDPCESCIGRRDPAPSCAGGDQCATGVQACGLPGQPACPAGSYCVTGCCQPIPS